MEDSTPNIKLWIGVGFTVILSILGLITLFSAMNSVGTGKVGVVTNYGKVTGRELGEGLSWIAPWGVESVTDYDIKTQKDEVTAAAATKDLQDVNGTLVLNYQLNRGEVSHMHQTVGKDWKAILVLPAINEVFKAASAKYTASELITNRAEVKKDVVDNLTTRLKKYGITVQDVSITNFSFSAAFNQAIEGVQIANQKIAQARQELETTKVEAEKQIAEAQAQAESQRLRQQTLTPEILQQQAISKWNGVMPQYSGSGSNLFFNIPTGK